MAKGIEMNYLQSSSNYWDLLCTSNDIAQIKADIRLCREGHTSYFFGDGRWGYDAVQDLEATLIEKIALFAELKKTDQPMNQSKPEIRDEDIALIDAKVAGICAKIVSGDYSDELSMFLGRENAILGDLGQLQGLSARREAILIAERAPIPDAALRLAVERTRQDLGPVGHNYLDVRKLLEFAEQSIEAGSVQR